ncbi:hypothetical protein BGZ91_009786 [Linnemannia elongata]|nr:hypothetical protein BGZ91_009786 [Linnemannia elongata]
MKKSDQNVVHYNTTITAIKNPSSCLKDATIILHTANPNTAPPPLGPHTKKHDWKAGSIRSPLPKPQNHAAMAAAREVALTVVNAHLGDTAAQVTLGKMYVQGQGFDQDYKVAMDWYNKAAERGNMAAIGEIGFLYYSGTGVPQDYERARVCTSMAAERGYWPAQLRLGKMYREANGVQQDDQLALNWFLKAAEQGDGEAYYEVGRMFLEGRVVDKDKMEAVGWFREAARLGYKRPKRCSRNGS